MSQKLFIGTACYTGEVSVWMMNSVVNSGRLLDQLGIHWIWQAQVGGCYLPPSRNKIVRNFLATDCTDLLMLDSDVEFDPGAIPRIMAFDRPVIAGAYPYKSDAEEYPIWLNAGPDGKPVLDPTTGLIEARGLPTGFMRIQRGVFDRITEAVGRDELMVTELTRDGESVREQYLNFFDTYKEGNLWWGEDYAFCRLWREKCGGKAWVLPDIDFKHHGSKGFSGNFWKHVNKE